MIFNENGMIINNHNTWMENVNRDIDELNSIIESIQIDYLHEGFNLKETARKFIDKVKKIFEWIKQKIKEIKNLIKSKFDPLINKIKSNKDKIVNNFNKLSKEQKEKLFKKNNSVNESSYLYESTISLSYHPSTITKKFSTATYKTDRVFYHLKDNDSKKDAEDYYDNHINVFKNDLIGESVNRFDYKDNLFEQSVQEYFKSLRDIFDNLDIDEIIDIATNGSSWLVTMEINVNKVEKMINDKINSFEISEQKLYDDNFCYIRFFLNRVLKIINIYTPHAINYIKTITLDSGRICAQLLKDKINSEAFEKSVNAAFKELFGD